jgi:hypothetical protein
VKAEDQFHWSDGEAYWTYHRLPSGPRVELISRDVQSGLDQYWAMPR